MKTLFQEVEATKRDSALNMLEGTRSGIIAAAMAIAVELAKKNGRVSSSEVIAALRERGHAPDQFDKRFMGAVFRRGWERICYVNGGSHARPISVWRLKA